MQRVKFLAFIFFNKTYYFRVRYILIAIWTDKIIDIVFRSLHFEEIIKYVMLKPSHREFQIIKKTNMTFFFAFPFQDKKKLTVSTFPLIKLLNKETLILLFRKKLKQKLSQILHFDLSSTQRHSNDLAYPFILMNCQLKICLLLSLKIRSHL